LALVFMDVPLPGAAAVPVATQIPPQTSASSLSHSSEKTGEVGANLRSGVLRAGAMASKPGAPVLPKLSPKSASA
jgi:hypothetical protein